MSDVSEALLKHIPYLRRHARLLTGSQEVGDEYVRICLEMVIAEPHHLANGDLKVQLFRAFHAVWRVVTTTISEGSPLEHVDLSDRLEQGLSALPPLERRVLLLAVVEKFTHEEVARFMGLPKKKLSIIKKAIRVYNAAPQSDQGEQGWSIDEMLQDSRSKTPDTERG